MSKYEIFKLGEVCEVIAGQSPPSSTYNKTQDGLPFFQGKADFGRLYPVVRIWCNRPIKIAKPNDIFISVRAPVGPTNLCNQESCIGRGLSAIRTRENVNNKYLFYYLRWFEPRLTGKGQGSTFSAITQQDIKNIPIPLPPLPIQKKIAGVLERADAAREKRRQANALTEQFLQSAFLEMFGDPVRNPKGWEKYKLVDMAEKFSDGPFGSNLKTEHYTDEGIRVIRLQNIGVGKLIDNDKVYISENHFSNISKHTCLPGDVIIGTLGEPNLRACILPSTIPIALNKADCIQMRPKKSICNSEYICWLLNQPSTLFLASGMIHGQTRLRINMGRLRELVVPCPPLRFQEEFASLVEKVERILNRQRASEIELCNLFQSLMRKAFKGELAFK